MDKRLIFPQNIDDRRDVYFVKEDRVYLRKHASAYHPEIAKYIEDAKPIDNLVQVLLTALGAFEYWGQNVNGDQFKIPALTHRGDDYGVDTFKNNANYFLHHVNKDPALAKGKVLKAVWNDKAKRVELVVGIDVNLDPEGVSAIDRGDDVCFSMGARLPFDVCSICGNKAKTRAEYCDHLRYMMNQIDPVANKLVGADNLFPKFFDISRVLIPADKTAYMWAKIAAASNPYKNIGSAQLAELPAGKINDTDYLIQKVAEQRETYREKLGRATKIAVAVKNAAMTKRIELKFSPALSDATDKVVPPAKTLLQEASPSISNDVVDKILATKANLSHILSTFAALGMEPKEDEMTHLVVRFHPRTEEVEKLRLSPDYFHPEVASHLLPLLQERSFYRPILVKRIVTLANGLDARDTILTKQAQSVSELIHDKAKQEESVHPAYIAGFVAALYALFGNHASGVAKHIGRIAADHPLALLPIAAGAYAGSRVLFNGDSRVTGFYGVDRGLDGLYNKSWQSRFADMQARPVTVIKTGDAKIDTALAKKVFYGVPAIFLGSSIIRANHEGNAGPNKASQFIANNPEILSAGLIGEHLTGKPISNRISKLLNSGSRIIKNASLNNIEFLMAVPESEQELVWDTAIYDSANQIYKFLNKESESS
jgi:hypothetical protein